MAEKLPSYVRPMPRVLERVQRVSAVTVLSHVLLRRRDYESLRGENPSIRARSILAHEQVHIDRGRRFGVFKHSALYYGDRRYRLDEEIAAYQAEMRVVKESGLIIDFNPTHYTGIARALAGPIYLWAAPTINSAMDRLKQAWDTA